MYDQLSNVLYPNERVEWQGHPDPNVLFTPLDVYLVPLSLLWVGFALFLEVTVVRFGGPTLLGIPPVVLGAYLVVGRFFVKRWTRRHTVYAVTNRRVLVVFQMFHRCRVRSEYLYALPAVYVTTRSGGSGSIEFGCRTLAPSMWGSSGLEFFLPDFNSFFPGFHDIDKVREVGELIDRLREPLVRAA